MQQSCEMLCSQCEKFTSDILNRDFSTWKKVNADGLHTFFHHDFYGMQAALVSGCTVCGLLFRVREERMPSYSDCGEKWLRKPASIDVTYLAGDGIPSFKMTTVAPEKRTIEFEFFSQEAWQAIASKDIDSAPDHNEIASLTHRISAHPVDATDVARYWLQKCMSRHVSEGSCISSDMPELPSRVIDVGPADGSMNPKLLSDQEANYGHYVTLSHCWGTKERLTTNSRTLEQHLKGIAMEDLPGTFRDAVILVRRLGFRFLWIDALCIIQDDHHDWLDMSERMHLIFAQATLSISAADALDSHAGILPHRIQPSVEVDFNGRTIGLRAKSMSSTEAITTSVLDKRAWCLQERLLPSRVLFYGREQLYWRCRTSQASESMPEFFSQCPTYRPQVWKLIWEQDPRIRQDAWLDVLTQYSERLITRPSDRVHAIEGLATLAETYQKTFRLRLGMPLEAIERSMLWRRTHWHRKASHAQHPSDLRRTSSFRTELLRKAEDADGNEEHAPSWSWASLNRPINWNWRYSLVDHIPSDLDATIDTDRQWPQYWAEPDYIPVGPRPKDFHQMWRLTAHGRVRRGSCKVTHNGDSGSDIATYTASGNPNSPRDEIPCSLDHRADFVSTTCYALYITSYATPPNPPSRSSTGLSASSTDGKKRGKASGGMTNNEQAFVVLLERAELAVGGEVSDAYRRVGIGQGAAKDVQRMFRDTPWTTITIW